MKKPELPNDEITRLEKLKSLNILDTAPEERFDRLTRLASRLFKVPIALVSLVDMNRQWFKSCVGLGVRETSRDISFCGHSILGNAVLIVPNTLEDERFADNPLVVEEPFIRFYAGCPLHAPNGSKLGTLCIIDRQPRILEPEDIETLKDLASMAERELATFDLAMSDELTKITNRRGFMALAQHSLGLCRREGRPACLIFLDLDKFKFINDNFGHAEGDRTLICFANQMRSNFRTLDIIARFGGDEFVVLLSSASIQQAEIILKKFSQSLKAYVKEENLEYDITFSYGIVEINHKESLSIDELLASGDSLMYEVKRGKQ